MSRFRSLCLDPNAQPGTAGAPAAPPATATATAITQPAPPAVPPAARANDLVTRMVAEHGSIDNAVRVLALRAITAEDTAATLSGQVAALKLPEGARVLTKAEADAWTPVLTLKPEEVVAGLKERDTLKAKDEQRTLGEQARMAAPLAALDPEAFEAYVRDKKLPIEMRDTQVNERGKTITKKMPFTRTPNDDKAAWQPLDQYVGTLPAFEQRALKATTAAGTAPATPAPASATATWPASRASAPPAPAGAPVDEFITRRDADNAKRRNPLFPAAPVPPVAAS
jgi:hypothetical protein